MIKFPLTTESAMKKIEDNNTLVSDGARGAGPQCEHGPAMGRPSPPLVCWCWCSFVAWQSSMGCCAPHRHAAVQRLQRLQSGHGWRSRCSSELAGVELSVAARSATCGRNTGHQLGQLQQMQSGWRAAVALMAKQQMHSFWQLQQHLLQQHRSSVSLLDRSYGATPGGSRAAWRSNAACCQPA